MNIRRFINSRVTMPTVAWMLVASLTLAAVSYVVVRVRIGATQTADRLVVSTPADQTPVTNQIVAALGARGFASTKDPQRVSALTGSNTKTVVFTPTALRAAVPDTLRSLYRRGVVLAPLDVPLPELQSLVGPPPLAGPPGSAPPPAGADSGEWLGVSSQYTLYSIVRFVQNQSGTFVSRRSDVVYSVDHFYDQLTSIEQLDQAPLAPAPAPNAPAPLPRSDNPSSPP